jgi:6-phosphofructokinase 1
MGRNAGYLALWCGVAGGAEEVLFPEYLSDRAGQVSPQEAIRDKAIELIIKNRGLGKHHNLIVVAEGIGGSGLLAKNIEDALGIETRATILGHLQRGGTPTALDRMHASMMGSLAIQAIQDGVREKAFNPTAVGYSAGQYELLPIETALTAKRTMGPELYEMIKVLSV